MKPIAAQLPLIASLFLLSGCPEPTNVIGSLDVVITRVGEGSVVTGSVRCPSVCTFVTEVTSWPHQMVLRAEPAQNWVFEGWSGDCTGTEIETVIDTPDPMLVPPARGRVQCTATFRSVFVTPAPRTEVLISQVRYCEDTPGGVDCTQVPPRGLYDVRFPPEAATEVELNEHCYATFDEELSSLDRGPLDLVTARMPSGRATHDGTGYRVTGQPGDDNPFGAVDSLAVTTTAGTATVPAPSANLVVFQTADGPTVGAGSAPDAVHWIAFGETSEGVYGEIYCRFPGAAEFLFSPPAAREALTASGIDPDLVFTGVLNVRDLTGLTGGPHRAGAGRHLYMSATQARAIGAL
ncbi:MAG: hypothetical protein HS111_10545 [Kofleriaceae bacterium]|nr:hypothetical protein [Kofleriaceae bacterium]MCL4223248.1 hypothetical protein [Myxococcales bacterium]